MRTARSTVTLGMVAIAGCSPPSPPARDATLVPAPAPTLAPVDAASGAMSVALVGAPDSFTRDGDVGEWGPLAPSSKPLPGPPPHPSYRRVGTGAPTPVALPPSGPNAAKASSRIAIALTQRGALVAGELAGPVKDGVWIGVGTAAPVLPQMGAYQRGGSTAELDCEYERVNLGDGLYGRGEKNPPETVAACRGLIARHAAFVEDHERRFARLFKVEVGEVREARPEGLVEVSGAAATFAQKGEGATFEVELPLDALPRLVEAPLRTLRVVARAATTATPPDLSKHWVWLAMPEPLSFEHLLNKTFYEPSLSYHPSDPSHVESVRYPSIWDHETMSRQREVLYEKHATFGDLEVGYLSAYTRTLVVLRDGRVVGRIETKPDRPVDMTAPETTHGVVERDGELHVLSYSPAFLTEGYGPEAPGWIGVAIRPDGTWRTDLVDSGGGVFGWEEVTEFVEPNLNRFGLRGTTAFPEGMDRVDPPVGLEVSWQWDARARAYVEKKRRIAAPKKPKPAAAPSR